MALGAVLAAALTTPAARAYGLYINGLDVIRQPGVTGNGYGVPIDSIHLVENGPGQVSSLEFTLEDPLVVLDATHRAVVLLMDHRVGTPLFLGFIDSPTITPLSIGRAVRVTCVGIECLLDWAYSPAIAWPANMLAQDMIQSLVANSISPGYPLRTFGLSPYAQSFQDTPVAIQGTYDPALAPITVPAGTLRQAIQYVIDLQVAGHANSGWTLTVDYYGGLRVVQTLSNPGFPWLGAWDWSFGLAINIAAGRAPANPDYGIDHGTGYHQVYVTGTGGSSAVVSDGTGIIGQVATLSDPNLSSVTALQGLGMAFLGRNAATTRGSVTLDPGVMVQNAPGTEWHAGISIALTDPQLGLSAASFNLGAIEKTFSGGGIETWTIHYGGTLSRLSSAVRQLTRATTN